MLSVSKILAPLGLALGIAVAASVAITESNAAQPPFGKGQQPPPRKGAKSPFGKGDQPFGKEFPGKGDGDRKFEDKKGPKADVVVEAWLRVLIEKITDPHDTVRDSARGAVISVGRPAIPTLQRLADGDDPAKAVAARKLIHAIEDGPGPQGRASFGGFGGPGFPGGPGMGPMGPGGMGGFGPPGKGPDFKGDRDRGPNRDRRKDKDDPPVAPFPGTPGRSAGE